jgi:hypothetical protein
VCNVVSLQTVAAASHSFGGTGKVCSAGLGVTNSDCTGES